MPENFDKNKTFATSGQESFDLNKGNGEEKEIVLDIQEEHETSGVLLNSSLTKNDLSTGNFLQDAVASINRYLAQHSAVKIQDKATFYQLLSVMVNSGIPMVKSLRSLAGQMESAPKLKLVVEEVAEFIENGASFSESVSSYPEIFLEQEVGMIQAGEASGQMGAVLGNLAIDTEKAYSIRSKVKSALTYPVVIFILLFGVIAVMMVFVIPQLTELFSSTGQELPLITRIVVGISDFMVNEKLTLILAILGLFIGIKLFKKTYTGKVFFDRLVINVPIFGKLVRMALLARFARSLSNLLESSISIVKAIEITANSIGNEVYRQRILLSKEDVSQGIPIAESLTDSPLFPAMLITMMEVGEQTAQMDTITAKIAEFYESEVDTAVNGISKIIEPVILVVIGLTVGGVVAAIMMPIMQLTNIAGSV